nr:hypothetical protein [Tanacetum cinerariifolium]GEX50652.1 hypothetical protein [Tanacetum cinerariifolium]
MAISIILVFLDSSEESVWTSTGRVILFGTIPTTIPDNILSMTPPTTHIDTTPIPIVSSTIPPSPDYTPTSPDYTHASPDYSPASDIKTNPSEDPSSDHIQPLPAISPFFSSTDDSSSSDIPDTPPSPTHGTPFNETTLSTQRSPAASRSFRRRVMVLAPGQPIPHGPSYCYYLNGPVQMITDDSLGDSLSSSLSEISSDPSSDDISDSSFDHSLSAQSLGMRPSHHLCSLVPSIPCSSAAIIDRPSHDFSSASPSFKRSRSPTAYIPLSSPIPKALSYTRTDVLPSSKRIRSFEFATGLEVSLEDSFEPYVPRETDLEIDVDVAETDECIAYADALRDRGIDVRVVVEAVDRDEIKMGVRGLVEVRVDRVTHPVIANDIPEPTQEEGAIEVTYETLGDLVQRTMPNTRSGAKMTHEAVNEQIDRRLAGALGARDSAKNLEPLLEIKEMNLAVKGNDLTAYTRRFQELVSLYTRMVPNEEDNVDRFVGGLPNNIQGNVIATEPTKLQDVIRIANNLMDQKLKGCARSAKNKRRLENNLRDNRSCTVRCGNCKSFGHMTRDCKKHGNKTKTQTGGNETIAKAYAIGGKGANPDFNVVTGTFLLNNCYASMLFDSGADRSFVSSTFSAMLNVAPSALDTSYAVELADEKVSETIVILRGCTLGLLGHSLDIDLMHVEFGSLTSSSVWIGYRSTMH